ncbi:pyridoxal phosphate-dependent aminotransferase [bacterium]|nr:pyridoxal phosphate-dependent aminotransferase [bacterium]
MVTLSSRVAKLKSSSIMEIAARAQTMKSQGIDVVSLAAGEPDFNTPKAIQEAATAAMAEGITKYTPAAGFLSLREVLAEKISRENKFPVSPEEIIVTSGAKHAIYLALQCLADEGDTILVPTPAWVSYRPMIELTGANLVPLPLFEEDGFRLNVDRWKGLAIPSSAKGIILNSPNNPTGVVYSAEELKKFVGWALQRNLWIMSDEIYEKTLYDGVEHVSVASLGPEVRNYTITVSGFSKSHCMTGWRLGWAIGNRELIQKMAALQSQSVSHVTSFVQWAGIAAAKLPDSVVDEMVKEFDSRRRYCMGRLDALSEYCTYTRPTGAFYFYVGFGKWLKPRGKNDLDFCKDLLMTHHVAAVPGSSFGKENFVRLSYANSQANLEKAFDRLEAFLKQG